MSLKFPSFFYKLYCRVHSQFPKHFPIISSRFSFSPNLFNIFPIFSGNCTKLLSHFSQHLQNMFKVTTSRNIRISSRSSFWPNSLNIFPNFLGNYTKLLSHYHKIYYVVKAISSKNKYQNIQRLPKNFLAPFLLFSSNFLKIQLKYLHIPEHFMKHTRK